MFLGIVVGYATQRYGSARTAGHAADINTRRCGANGVERQRTGAGAGHYPRGCGRWAGVAEGQPGKGDATREYVSELRSKIIYAKHRGIYPPQPANPKGEVHEDLGIYSYDRAASRVRFRQFHVEGFVIHYVQEPDSKPGTWGKTSRCIRGIV